MTPAGLDFGGAHTLSAETVKRLGRYDVKSTGVSGTSAIWLGTRKHA